MPFKFQDRVVQYPGRIRLTPVSGQANVYDVERSEGIILNPGTPLTAENMMKLQEYSNVAGLALEAEKASGYTKGGAIDMALRDLFKRRDTAVYAFEAEQAQVARDYSNGGKIYREFNKVKPKLLDSSMFGWNSVPIVQPGVYMVEAQASGYAITTFILISDLNKNSEGPSFSTYVDGERITAQAVYSSGDLRVSGDFPGDHTINYAALIIGI